MVAVEVLFAIGLGLAGFCLWIATNVHIRWTKRELQAYGTDARKLTEAYVSRELEALGTNLGGFEARMTAQMPPNVDGRLEELEGSLDGLIDDLKGRFDALPTALTDHLEAFRAREGVQMKIALREQGEGLSDELKAAQVALGPMQVQGDPRAAIMKAITRPTPAKFAKENPLAAMIMDAGKVKMAEWLQTSEGGTVTYTVKSKGGGASPF